MTREDGYASHSEIPELLMAHDLSTSTIVSNFMLFMLFVGGSSDALNGQRDRKPKKKKKSKKNPLAYSASLATQNAHEQAKPKKRKKKKKLDHIYGSWPMKPPIRMDGRGLHSHMYVLGRQQR